MKELNRRHSMWTITEDEDCLEENSLKSYGISCGSVAIRGISTRKISEFVELLNRTDDSEIFLPPTLAITLLS